MRAWARSALLFTAIGLCLYAGVHAGAEHLLWRAGHGHPLFQVAAAPAATYDWVILGASHAMPLGFGESRARMEAETGLEILNLASPGTGPVYNHFVLEGFLERHRGRNLLYVADSFAFYSRTWNEERFTDAKLLRRTPLEAATARRLWRWVRHGGVDLRALLDYLSGFSKINNRERFQRDAWEGEAQFERSQRPSAAAVAKRVAYLYPDQTPVEARERYLAALSGLLALAERSGMRAVAVKMPVPAGFRAQLPGEADFDAALGRVLAARGVPFHDLSGSVPEPSFYFDTDHLNREGVAAFLERDLRRILESGKPAASPPR